MLAQPDERICLRARRHGVVLVRPFAKAGALAAAGAALAVLGWPATVAAATLLALAALVALRAAWRWERTQLVVTTEKVVVVDGTLRRRAATVGLGRIGAVELEQTLAGRLLGYGTVVAGDLEIPYVPQPRRVAVLVDRLARH
ncbi:MAG TPA: PH domain-containing protein [Gaiellaceae bacterium]|nr:PH domain-containing protein [Gaiellaceae bacterium]